MKILKYVSKKLFSFLVLFLHCNTNRAKFLEKIMKLLCIENNNIFKNFAIGTF